MAKTKKDLVLDYYAKHPNATGEQVQKALGVSASTVANARKEAGMTRNSSVADGPFVSQDGGGKQSYKRQPNATAEKMKERLPPAKHKSLKAQRAVAAAAASSAAARGGNIADLMPMLIAAKNLVDSLGGIDKAKEAIRTVEQMEAMFKKPPTEEGNEKK